MENVKNASAANNQLSLRNSVYTEKSTSFFNDILSSSKNQLSLSGKYAENLNSDRTGNFNKAYSFVKDDPKPKIHQENSNKSGNKKSSERPEKSEKTDKYENRSSNKIKNESLSDPSVKTADQISENDEVQTNDLIEKTAEISKGKVLTTDKKSLEPEIEDLDSEYPLLGILTEQQIKEIAVLIIDNLNNMKTDISEGIQTIPVHNKETLQIAKSEIMNILGDSSLDLKLILPKLQEYITQIANQNNPEDQGMSAEGIDHEILNNLFDSLIQEKSLMGNEKQSVKPERENASEEDLLIVSDNSPKPLTTSGKSLQNQLQLLKNGTDENLLMGDNSNIKDLIISDKKNSELLMDFSGPKTLIQGSSSVSAPQPFISRNASFLQMVSKITEEIRLSVDNNKTQMTLKLEPETLGRLTVKISSENGIMNASFYAENDKAKTMIENHMAELRNSLEKQGIQIQNLTVTVDQNQQEFTRHKNIMEAQSYSKNKSITINLLDEKEIEEPANPYFTQDLFNDLI